MARTDQIRGAEIVGQMLNQHVRRNPYLSGRGICSTPHLDEDSLSAFVEGGLTDGELRPIVSHLVECVSCRHASAELIRLSLDFHFEDAPQEYDYKEPGRLRRFLDDLAARVLTVDENAVLAYEAKTEDDKTEDHKPEEDEPEN